MHLKTSRGPRLEPAGGGRFDAIIFDMGGTLLEFENVPWEIIYPTSVLSLHQWLSSRNGKLASYDEFMARFEVLIARRRARIREQMREYQIGPFLRELLAGCGVPVPNDGLNGVINAYYAAVRRQVSVFPESRDVLQNLREQGYKIGLLSNTCFRERDHREELEMYGLWEYFDAALFTSTGRYRKPHPEPFREITDRLEVDPSRCLYIGDRQREDVLGPQAVGMTACLVRRRDDKYQPGLTESCEIRDLTELVPCLGH